MDHREFLKELFEDKEIDSKIVISLLPMKKARFFESYEDAADFVEKHYQTKQNIYTSGGLLKKDIKSGRGKEEDVVSIVGYWADIDFKTADKPTGIPTLQDVMDLVKGHNIDPTLVINTGNGVHCWWLFKEPWELKDEDERQQAKMFNNRLQTTIQLRAIKKGWSIDKTHDLCRILRIPGTQNNKDTDNPLAVEAIETTGPKYGDPVQDFDPYIISEQDVQKNSSTNMSRQIIDASNNIEFTLDTHAEPPAEQFQEIVNLDSKFLPTWNGERTDFPSGKHSASEHAQALANFAAECGWTDQEIADLIVAFYRRNLNNPKIEGTPTMAKAMRPEYIQRTIALARVYATKRRTEDYIENMGPLLGTEHEKKIDPDGKMARERIFEMMGLRVLEVTEYKHEKDAEYEMKVEYIHPETGNLDIIDIMFKTTSEFTDFTRFKNKVFECTRLAIPIKKKVFEIVVLKYFGRIMKVKLSEIQTSQQRMKSWLEMYLVFKNVNTTIDDAAKDASPFIHKGNWHVFIESFKDFVDSETKSNIRLTELVTDMTRIGAVKTRYGCAHPYHKNRRHSIRPYQIPAQIVATPPTLVKTTGGTPNAAVTQKVQTAKNSAVSGK